MKGYGVIGGILKRVRRIDATRSCDASCPHLHPNPDPSVAKMLAEKYRASVTDEIQAAMREVWDVQRGADMRAAEARASAETFRHVTVQDATEQAKQLAQQGRAAYERETSLADVPGRERSAQDVTYRRDGEAHREDGPAIIGSDGYRRWCFNGVRHRTDGPAVIAADGTQEWFLHGKRHRADGPAIIKADGTQEWWLNGKRNREAGPARIQYYGGRIGKNYKIEWHQRHKFHREDGPAVIGFDGTQEWYHYNKRHREDGPAVIYPEGKIEWFWRGKPMSENAILLRAGHDFTAAELESLALSDDEAEREGAIRHPDCPEHVRVFALIGR